jgi:regulatory protein
MRPDDPPTGDTAGRKAYQAGIRHLARRARSRAEIRGHLEARGYPPGIIEATLSRLMDEGLVDDRELALSHVENRERFSPRSRFALGYELKQRGIDPSVRDEVLAQVDEHRSAREAVARRQHLWRHLDPEVFKRKVLGFLRNRGFSAEVSMAAIEDALSRQNQENGRNHP